MPKKSYATEKNLENFGKILKNLNVDAKTLGRVTLWHQALYTVIFEVSCEKLIQKLGPKYKILNNI